MKPTEQIPFAQQIRQAVRESGLTPYRICKDTGIDQGQMSRFLSGQMWLGEDTMNRLAEYLGWRLVSGADAGTAKPTQDFQAEPIIPPSQTTRKRKGN
jgi:transcriptional regulator with XRE-family HTH domain